jgi:hypothetical protein
VAVSHGLCTLHRLAIQFCAMTLRAGVAKLAGAALAGSLLFVAAPATALACQPHHGGGNSEVNQYLETIPGPCGDQPVGGNPSGNQGTSSGPGSSAAGIPPATLTHLESLGPQGAQTAGFAQATNPGGGSGKGSGNGSGQGSSGSGQGSSGSGQSATTSGGGGSLLDALKQAVTGANASDSSSGQGLGTLLPILLGMVLLGGLGVLALRRGRTG